MLSEPAVVVASQPDGVTIKAERSATCSACDLRKGCGQYLLGADRAVELAVPHDAPASFLPGQPVMLVMGKDSLVTLTALLYLLPVCMLTGAVALAWWLGAGEPVQAGAAAAGLVAGVLLGRLLLRSARCDIAVQAVSSGTTVPAIPVGDPFP